MTSVDTMSNNAIASSASENTGLQLSQPNNTLYVSNIDWKVKKALLKRALYMLMTRHGKVLDVVVLRKDGLRGQAFVIFDDVRSATDALRLEQGFKFFGKELKLAYANEPSDRIAKRDGTYVPKDKRKSKRSRTEDAGGNAKMGGDVVDIVSTKASTTATTTGEVVVDTTATTTSAEEVDTDAVPPPPPPPIDAVDQPEPSHILFAENLPTECNEMMLAMLFRQYSGFKEVRIPRGGLAFIEFDNEPHATLALERLNGFQLTTTDSLNLTYGKA